jgi:hypothetical protein
MIIPTLYHWATSLPFSLQEYALTRLGSPHLRQEEPKRILEGTGPIIKGSRWDRETKLEVLSTSESQVQTPLSILQHLEERGVHGDPIFQQDHGYPCGGSQVACVPRQPVGKVDESVEGDPLLQPEGFPNPGTGRRE